MSVIFYILLALALGFSTSLVVRSCAEHNPVRLSYGLVVALTIALVHAVFLAAGAFLAGGLTFSLPEVDSLVYAGLLALVAVKLWIGMRGKNRPAPAYDISRWTTVLLLAVATGVNVLVAGLGVGFIASMSADLWKCVVPMVVITFLLLYFAIMLGRRKVQVKPRLWTFVSVLLLLSLVVFVLVRR